MSRINVTSLSAIVLLLFCGAMYAASFDIRVTDYSTLQPSVWPRLVLAALAATSALLLLRAVAYPRAQEVAAGPDAVQGEEAATRLGLARYRNAAWIFATFLAFIIALPWLGMPLAGAAFVFLALTALGNNDAKSILMHVVVAILSVGLMWAIFRYLLHVFLPWGEILPYL